MRVQASVTSVAAAALLFFAAASADAACPRPSANPPAVPNGATADEESMKAAHDAIQAYVNQLEAYKACLKDQAEHTPDVSLELAKVWLAQGDAAVDYASYIAAEFSTALKQFKARQAPAQPSK